MNVGELKNAIKNVSDDAIIILVDGDTGDHYTPDSACVGFVRTAHYKTENGMESDELWFDKNMDALGIDCSDMKKFSVDHYRVDNAVRIE